MNFNKKIFIVLFISVFVSCTNRKKESILISKQDSLYVFNFANQRLKVDVHGGRIISFQQNDIEIIGTGGSTFWVSPQSHWSWPPIKQHHDAVYNSQITGDTLILKSKKDDLLNVEIIKMIYPNSIDTSFTIRYGILNSGDSSINVAPWENTRTFKTALLFYPQGSTDSTASNPIFGNLKLVKSESINWFAFGKGSVMEKNMGKIFADGAEGWIAEANNGLILIKKFQDIPLERQAPGEGEIEIFADLDHPFLEMEEQGPYTRLNPGQTLWWEVKWILRKVPEKIELREGNEKLIKYVKNSVY